MGERAAHTRDTRGSIPSRRGQDHYAAYLANTDGFEVELVARKT